jgi:hypothetical protein
MTEAKKASVRLCPDQVRRLKTDAAARMVWQDETVKTTVAERLYRAVLTASAQPGLRSQLSGCGGSWPTIVRDMADHFGAAETEEGETKRDVAKRLAASRPEPRYQPTRKDLDDWLDTLTLLEGFGVSALHRCTEALKVYDSETAKLQSRLDGLRSGKIPASFEIRERRMSELQVEIVKTNRHRKGLVEAIEFNTGLGRKALGALKGAGMVWFFGAPRSGLKKWDYIAGWANVETGLMARKLHDEALYWAMASEQLKREGLI